MIARISRIIFGALAVFALMPMAAVADSAYSAGSYGACGYGSCGISLTSNATLANNVTPGSGTTCSVASDSVAVTTDSSTGYTLTLNDSDTSNQLTGSGNSIAASGGSQASPASLGANSWGYRVDGIGGFGAGPTSALSNGSVPAQTYAAIPVSSASPDTIASSNAAANPAVSTSVWYGLCVNSALPNGTYSDSITYTAVTN